MYFTCGMSIIKNTLNIIFFATKEVLWIRNPGVNWRIILIIFSILDLLTSSVTLILLVFFQSPSMPWLSSLPDPLRNRRCPALTPSGCKVPLNLSFHKQGCRVQFYQVALNPHASQKLQQLYLSMEILLALKYTGTSGFGGSIYSFDFLQVLNTSWKVFHSH